MSYEQPLFRVGLFQANIDMSVEATYQYTFVNIGVASGTGVQGTGVGNAALVMPISAGVAGFGILQNNPQLAEAGAVFVEGISKAKISGTVAVGDHLMIAGTDGTLVKATSGNYQVAKALESGSSGDIIAVLLRNFGKL